jgi:hypothetical protein
MNHPSPFALIQFTLVESRDQIGTGCFGHTLGQPIVALSVSEWFQGQLLQVR